MWGWWLLREIVTLDGVIADGRWWPAPTCPLTTGSSCLGSERTGQRGSDWRDERAHPVGQGLHQLVWMTWKREGLTSGQKVMQGQRGHRAQQALRPTLKVAVQPAAVHADARVIGKGCMTAGEGREQQLGVLGQLQSLGMRGAGKPRLQTHQTEAAFPAAPEIRMPHRGSAVTTIVSSRPVATYPCTFSACQHLGMMCGWN